MNPYEIHKLEHKTECRVRYQLCLIGISPSTVALFTIGIHHLPVVYHGNNHVANIVWNEKATPIFKFQHKYADTWWKLPQETYYCIWAKASPEATDKSVVEYISDTSPHSVNRIRHRYIDYHIARPDGMIVDDNFQQVKLESPIENKLALLKSSFESQRKRK